MPTSVTLYRWTDQGLRNIKDTVKRTQAAISAMGKQGGRSLFIGLRVSTTVLLSSRDQGTRTQAMRSSLAFFRPAMFVQRRCVPSRRRKWNAS